MAGFCTYCGKPLPENGVCSCQAAPQQQYAAPQQQYAAPQQQYAAPQQQYAPQYAQQQYAQQNYQQQYQQQQYGYAPVYAPQGPSVFAKFFKTLTDYFKDPVGTSRNALSQRDVTSGGIAAALCILLTLFGTMFFTLINDYDFGDIAPAWVVVGLFAPAIAIGISFGLSMILANIAKAPVDPTGLFAATCVNTILPMCLLAASMILSLIGAVVFEIFAIMLFAAWAITTLTMIFQVLNIKMNIISICLIIAAMAVSYVLMMVLLNWLLFDGEIVLYITWFFDLMH